MLASAFLLLMNGAFLTLRLGNNGSFPRPLSPEEERSAEAASLLGEDGRLLWDDGAGWEIRFRVLEWWGALLSRWEGRE